MAPIKKDFHLTILDQTMLRMYVRHLIIFPFPDPKCSELATRALRSGLSATLVRLPFLAGMIAPSEEQASRLTLRYPEPISEALIDQIFTVDLDRGGDLRYDYEKLESAGFSPSELSPDVFCPDLLRNHPGLDDAFAERLISYKSGLSVPVFATRVTFIRGGLVLSVYSNHTAVDGNGIAKIYQTWSACIRSQTDQSLGLALSPESEMDSARRKFDSLADSHGSRPIDCPEVRFPGGPRRVPAIRETPYNTTAKIFVLPASTVNDLTNSLSSLSNTRLSKFTALIALLWTQITLARSSSLLTKKVRDTRLCIAYDHRKNLGQEYVDSYLGNCATGTLVTHPLPPILSTTSDTVNAEHLAPIAVNIVTSLSLITLDWLKDRLTVFSRTPNSYQCMMEMDVMNGPDLFVTSWMHMGADCAWSIPGTQQSTASAIRKPQSKVEGNIHFLPRSKTSEDKAFEILLCLEEGEMERVMSRMEREGWVERIVDA